MHWRAQGPHARDPSGAEIIAVCCTLPPSQKKCPGFRGIFLCGICIALMHWRAQDPLRETLRGRKSGCGIL
jgi:hypothetical protein